jgi:predicted NAD/FAD-binding protein
MTIPGGSQQYIDAVMIDFPKENVHISTPVASLTNDPSGAVLLKTSDGSVSTYDHVILATHGDQAKSIIEPSIKQEEETILSGFKTSKNTAALHSDLRVRC